MNAIFKYLQLLFVSNCLIASPVNDTEKYESFGLIWGFLKYHHPQVSKGKYDWDAQFIDVYSKVEGAATTNDLNAIYKIWINGLGEVPTVKPLTPGADIFTQNEDYRWFETSGFDADLKAQLNKIKEGKHKAGDYYVKVSALSQLQDFSNEKGFKGFDVTLKSHRLLNLFSFWNAMQYWNLNKYLFDNDWMDILQQGIPLFLAADNIADMEKAKAWLFARMSDSHTEYISDTFPKMLLSKQLPFGVVNCNDTLVINAVYNKALFSENNMALGDAIIGIGGKPVAQVLQERVGTYISAGNINYLRGFSNMIIQSPTEFTDYTILHKSGQTENVKLRHYDKFDYDKQRDYIKGSNINLPADMAYLNLKEATKSSLKDFFTTNKDKKAVILDIRNYPKNFTADQIAYYLYPERKKFVSFMGPANVPGLAQKDIKNVLRLIDDPFSAGSTNKNYYKGRVILLVNSQTMSQSEYLAMAIQQAPNCVTVGEPSAGVVANVVEYKLPDGTKMRYTGFQASYPDGEVVYRKGLKIDVPVVQQALKYDSSLIYFKAIEAAK